MDLFDMAGQSGRHEVLRKLLTDLRKKQSVTQSELASRLKKQQSFVSKYEIGERNIDVIEFIEILVALNLDPVETLKLVQEKAFSTRSF